ncbi:MAG: polyphosphate:AMP phosphotransferase [Verrucomicrobia bacterium]|nr:polyphosphate:AMP phosphotransferase [Verrucomicrobiota bacterium]MCH8512807.1 polyphosphate:AMP phosphotransferase [Kiritimatiellia bacterium]
MSASFEDIEASEKTKKSEFKDAIPDLRNELVAVQQALRNAKRPVMVLFAGVDGAGKHEMVNTLNAWMDPRGIVTHAYVEPNLLEKERPLFWRYWRDLAGNGQIGLYLSAWYSRPLLQRVHRQISKETFAHHLREIHNFEQTLCENGVILIKVWMHLGKKDQRKRLEKLSADPKTEWQVKPGAWENWGHYDNFIELSEEIVQHSAKGPSPWLIVDGKRKRTRTLRVAREILARIETAMETPDQATSKGKSKGMAMSAWNRRMKPKRGQLAKMDLAKTLERDLYKKKLKSLQRKLYQLQHQAKLKKISTVLVFEGQDAAGKGGAIRRLVQGLDAQEYSVIPIAAPTDEEKAHHYLWRFWRHLPRAGRVTIFDRSWYGRILVERVEGFAQLPEWQRAYEEINEFERQLCEHGTVLIKFWIQIDKDEQLHRFEERKNTPYKQWKITEEDWRNRKQWDAYAAAVDDMVALTHAPRAPWVLVEGNDKAHARIKVLETVCQHLEVALKQT